MTEQTFAVEVFQNEYLTAGASRVDAIVSVTATGAAVVPGPGTAAEVIIIDSSGSMRHPPTKLSGAKDAALAALDTLRDGVEFAIVAGTDRAQSVYPTDRPLAVADPRTREAAAQAVRRMDVKGGTAMGSWLQQADALLAGSTAALKHAILLTDGNNEHETAEELAAVLARVQGRFVCDCRGVGTDWQVKELRTIADAMLGTVDIVVDPEALAADFRALANASMGKAIADVALRLWTPQGALVKLVKQVEPTLLDLTGRGEPVPPLSADYPTGAWGAETRDYHVSIEVPPASVGDRMMAGRVTLIAKAGDGTEVTLGAGRILAVWTDDTALSTKLNREVAHYTGQAELAAAIQEGLEARKAGDVETATAKLGRAVQLAAESGHTGTAKLLAKVVDVEDERTGTVRLKRNVAAVDEMTLDTRSSKTMRVRPGQGDGGGP